MSNAQAEKSAAVSVVTLANYLVGRRDAIVQVATARGGLLIGLLFVLSAGFAREYDGVSLRDEPWHLGIPVVASLGTSFVLYLLLFTTARIRGVANLQFLPGYFALLKLYWFTAPLAWLYAIPFERLLSSGDAMRANLWLLAIVSLWRVALMVRVVTVWFGASLKSAIALVMLFGTAVAAVLVFTLPMPVWDLMGGVRHTAEESVILGAMCTAQFLGVVSLPVWLISVLAVMVGKAPAWHMSILPAFASTRIGRPLWLLTGCALGVWPAILPFTQPEQQHCYRAEKLLGAGDLSSAAEYLAKFAESDLPPHWNPPPRIGYGQYEPDPVEVLFSLESASAPDWIVQVYSKKILRNPGQLMEALRKEDGSYDEIRFAKILDVLERTDPLNEGHPSWRVVELVHNRGVSFHLRERLAKVLGVPLPTKPVQAEEDES